MDAHYLQPEEQNLRRHILLNKPEARELIRAVSHKLPPVSRHPKDTITVSTGVYRLHFRKALGTWLPQSIYRG